MPKPPTKRQPLARSIADDVQAALWALASAGATVVLPPGRKIPFEVIAGAVSYGFFSRTKQPKKPTRPKGRPAETRKHLAAFHEAERLVLESKETGRPISLLAACETLVESTHGEKCWSLKEQRRGFCDRAKKRRRDWFPKAKDPGNLSLGETFELIATEQAIVAGDLPGYPAPRSLRALHEK